MLTLYIVASLALIVKPGPDMICMLATALSHGKARAATLMAGLVLGCWIWILLLTAGVASFFADHPAVMTAVQCAGVVYIGTLAVGAFREARADIRRGDAGTPDPAAARGWRLVRRGVFMSMSNPLTVLFFLAFLPDFAKGASSLPLALKTFLLGTLFCALVPLVYLPVIFAADALRTRLLGSPRASAGLKFVSAAMLSAVVVALACRIAR